MTTVRNCPFCDEDQVEIGEPEPGEYAVDCPTCRCIGPYASSIESAIQLWNAPHDRDFKIDRLVREAREGFNVQSRRDAQGSLRGSGGLASYGCCGQKLMALHAGGEMETAEDD